MLGAAHGGTLGWPSAPRDRLVRTRSGPASQCPAASPRAWAARLDRCGRSGPTRRTGRLRRIPGSRLGPRGRSATRYSVVDRPEDLLGVDLAIPLHVGRLDDVLQRSADLQWNSHAPPPIARLRTRAGSLAAAHRAADVADIRGDEMHRTQVPLPHQLQKEGPHCAAATAGRVDARTDQNLEGRSRRGGTARPGDPRPSGRRADSPAKGWSRRPFRSRPALLPRTGSSRRLLP